MDRFKIKYLKWLVVLPFLCLMIVFLQIKNSSARRVIRKGNIDPLKSGLRSSTKIRCSGPGDPKCLGTNAPFKNNNSNKSGKITCSNPGDPACLGTDEPFKPGSKKPKPRTPTPSRNPGNTPPNKKGGSPPSTPPGSNTKIPASCPIVLKKACGMALMRKVDLLCSDSELNGGIAYKGDTKVKCYDPTDLLVKFDTSEIVVEVDKQIADTYLPNRNKEKPIYYNDICESCSNDLFASIADNYAITGENSLNCKKARVIAAGANECFQITLAAGKAYGVGSAIESKLQAACGASGLYARWNSMFGEQKGLMKFDGDMPFKFIHVGDIGASDSVKLTGNFLDGKYTNKSNTWERELLELANTYNNQVSGFCGKDYTVSMHNTNIDIINEKSSLERMVDEQGSLKGATTWGLNQASVFFGENTTNKIAKEGILGKNKEEKKKEGVVVPIKIEEIKIENFKEEKFKEGIKNILAGKMVGFYLLHDDKNFRIVEIKKNSGDDKLSYSTKDYDDSMDISNDGLKFMIKKTEKTDWQESNVSL